MNNRVFIEVFGWPDLSPRLDIPVRWPRLPITEHFIHGGDLDIGELARAYGIRHVRNIPVAVPLAAPLVSHVRKEFALPGERMGLLVSGANQHVACAWKFTEAGVTKGGWSMKPLAFPYVLPSSVAVTLAAQTGIRGFAISIGFDELCIVDMIAVAQRYLQAGFVDAVLAVVVNAPPIFLQEKFDLGPSFGGALCALAVLVIGESHPERKQLAVEQRDNAFKTDKIRDAEAETHRSFDEHLVSPKVKQVSGSATIDFGIANGVVALLEAAYDLADSSKMLRQTSLRLSRSRREKTISLKWV